MDEQLETTKLWAKTLNGLRQIKRLTGENMVEIVDRLVNRELGRLEKSRRKQAEKGKG